MLVEEISRAIWQFAPDDCGNCVNDEPQALFDSIRCLVSTNLARFRSGMAHGAVLQTLREVYIASRRNYARFLMRPSSCTMPWVSAWSRQCSHDSKVFNYA